LRANRRTNNEEEDENLPLTSHSPSSLIKLPKKLENVSRQSCDSRRIFNNSKREHEEKSFLPLELREQILISKDKNEVSVNLDIRNQRKKSYQKIRKCTCKDCE